MPIIKRIATKVAARPVKVVSSQTTSTIASNVIVSPNNKANQAPVIPKVVEIPQKPVVLPQIPPSLPTPPPKKLSPPISPVISNAVENNPPPANITPIQLSPPVGQANAGNLPAVKPVVFVQSNPAVQGAASGISAGGFNANLAQNLVPPPLLQVKKAPFDGPGKSPSPIIGALPLLDLPKLPGKNIEFVNGSTAFVTSDLGIQYDSLETIALSNFLPLFNVDGNLNEEGKKIQIKQDGLLISANSFISSYNSLADFQQSGASPPSSNKKDIKDFCDNLNLGIKDLLIQVNATKNLLIFDLNKPNYYNFPPGLSDISKEILNDNNPGRWASTKLWIQLCLQVKEYLMASTQKIFNEHAFTVQDPDLSSDYNSSYLLVKPKNLTSLKVSWRESSFNKNIKDPFDISGGFNAANAPSFSLPKDIFSFPSKAPQSSTDYKVVISKISHLLSKEYYFSSFINGPGLPAEYKYSAKIVSEKRPNFLDNLIGVIHQTNNNKPDSLGDITDIEKEPIGGDQSLISLSRFKSTRNPYASVLTFEDGYFQDDTMNGETPANSVITPGTFYLVDSAIQIDYSGNFNTNYLNDFLSILGTSKDTFANLFKAIPDPPFFGQSVSVSPSDSLKSPIALINAINLSISDAIVDLWSQGVEQDQKFVAAEDKKQAEKDAQDASISEDLGNNYAPDKKGKGGESDQQAINAGNHSKNDNND